MHLEFGTASRYLVWYAWSTAVVLIYTATRKFNYYQGISGHGECVRNHENRLKTTILTLKYGGSMGLRQESI